MSNVSDPVTTSFHTLDEIAIQVETMSRSPSQSVFHPPSFHSNSTLSLPTLNSRVSGRSPAESLTSSTTLSLNNLATDNLAAGKLAADEFLALARADMSLSSNTTDSAVQPSEATNNPMVQHMQSAQTTTATTTATVTCATGAISGSTTGVTTDARINATSATIGTITLETTGATTRATTTTRNALQNRGESLVVARGIRSSNALDSMSPVSCCCCLECRPSGGFLTRVLRKICCIDRLVNYWAFWPPKPCTYSFIPADMDDVISRQRIRKTRGLTLAADPTRFNSFGALLSGSATKTSQNAEAAEDDEEEDDEENDIPIRYTLSLTRSSQTVRGRRCMSLHSHQCCFDCRFVKTSRGERIATVHMDSTVASKSSPLFTIFYSHANACDIGTVTWMNMFLGIMLDCNVFYYDYSGYGLSTGRASELNIIADAEAAFQELLTRYRLQPDRVILLGQSLGSVPTVHLASRYRVAGVVIDSGMASCLRVVSTCVEGSWCCDALDIMDKIGSVTSPTLFIHSQTDSLTSYKHARQLYNKCPMAVEPLWLEEGKHVSLQFTHQYFSRLHRFIHVDILRERILRLDNMRFGLNCYLTLDQYIYHWRDDDYFRPTPQR